MKDCNRCRNAVLIRGHLTGDIYQECILQRKEAETASIEKLKELISHPERAVCKFERGKPVFEGEAYDD